MPGIFVLDGMGFQIPAGALVVTLDADGAPRMKVDAVRVRIDLWPTWLEIGCRHADLALAAGHGLDPSLPDEAKADLVSTELRDGLVAMTSFAIAIDGFYDTIRNEWGRHPDENAWKRKRTSRSAQVVETLRYHLKLGEQFSSQLRLVVDELFKFRGRAVHPDGSWVEPNYRPQLDCGVHPHFLTFSGPHAVQCRAMTLVLLRRLLDRAKELAGKGDDIGWIDRGIKELGRLETYRTAGDDQIAYPVPPEGTDESQQAASSEIPR